MLAEVHAHRRFATGGAAHVDRVYDFSLAPLVLHTVFTGDAAPLRRWLTTRPHSAVTVLDTHDGIGIVDGAGLLSLAQIEAVVETIESSRRRHGVASRIEGGLSGQLHGLRRTGP